MKKLLFSLLITITVLFAGSSFAQSSKYGWLPQDSWVFGFGGIYPRYVSTSLDIVEGFQNIGGYLSIQRNFSEHVGLRMKVNYTHLQGHVATPPGKTIKNNVFGADFDVLYYFAPVEPVSPYFGFGAGGFNSSKTGSPSASLNTSKADYQLNLVFGSEWKIGTNWRIKTELGYHNVASRGFDGVFGKYSDYFFYSSFSFPFAAFIIAVL